MKWKMTLEEREIWFINNVGWIPDEDEIRNLVKFNPGLAEILSYIFDLTRLNAKHISERREEKEEAENENNKRKKI